MMYFKNSVVGGFVILIAFACWINAKSSEAFGTFAFDIHHRYSDTVKNFLDVDGLPEKGSLDYYAALAHRDQLFKARRLATSAATSPSSGDLLTFLGGNETYRLRSLGFLHYSFVTVGTPALSFLVALDTGSDLFWLPCDCTDCVRSLNTSSGKVDLNIYSPANSSSSSLVPCNSTMCGQRRMCSPRYNACAYQGFYGPTNITNTSSTGILVDDVLHLGTNANPQKAVDAPITLGCGIVQTGDFIGRAGINGLFGLGLDNISVPSTLASKGLAANSFSMCFGPDGIGRIEFGDKGSPDQKVTPFNLDQLRPTYNVTVTQITVGRNVTDLEFTAIFDSGTSFTYLNDPAYSAIVDSFNSQVTEQPYEPPNRIIFDNCYALSANQNNYTIPDLNLTMKGGSELFITAPTIVIPQTGGGYAYCLAIIKSEHVDIIGQNFMTGYRMVFDREEMVLGWKESDCYGSISSNNLPVGKNNSADAPPPSGSQPSAPPPSVLEPEATPRNNTRHPISSLSPPPPSPPLFSGSNAARMNSMANGLLIVVLFSSFYNFVILSS